MCTFKSDLILFFAKGFQIMMLLLGLLCATGEDILVAFAWSRLSAVRVEPERPIQLHMQKHLKANVRKHPLLNSGFVTFFLFVLSVINY
jgi:hypothetical protein